MNEDAKRRFDAVAVLWKGCWDRIKERRTYEWKTTLTLWTALALLVGALLTNALPAGAMLSAGVGVLGALVVAAHWVYLAGLGKRHADDREMAIHYERILRNLTGSDFDPALKDRLATVTKHHRSLFREWSRRVQASVSFILWLTALLTSLYRAFVDP